MRPGEVSGQDYHFVDEAVFKEMLAAKQFLESATVHGAYYGTAKDSVDTQLASGADVILEIDWQGAEQVRKIYPEASSIFVLPPALSVLQDRLNARGQDSVAVIEKRVAAARSEMAQVDVYDYVIINDQFAEALEAFKAILCAARFSTEVQKSRHQALLAALTAA